MCKIRQFLKRKDIVISAKRYGIDALSAMAQGLFCTLLVGTILKTLGEQFNVSFLTNPIVSIGNKEYTIATLAQEMVGPGIAIAIAFALNCPPLVLFSMIPVGFATNQMGAAGGPLAVYIIAIVTCECGKLVSKETKIDIIITPIVTILVGIGLGSVLASHIGKVANSVGEAIKWATEQQPLIMGILVSVLVGMALTLPISSAAICIAFQINGIAGGAALAGCCAQMIGFAVMSYRENRVGGLIAQGIGTSMLQMPNILKNPRIWIPPTLAAAITGPLATCVFHLEMNGPAVSSGMGTCGFVGQIGVVSGWAGKTVTAWDWTGLILISFVLPAILSLVFCQFLRNIKWINENDLKLSL